MTAPWTLAVVVPAYRSGVALFVGLAELLRWRHPAVRGLEVIVVDDGSPECAFRDGRVMVGGVGLSFVVNQFNLGRSRSCLRGLLGSDADWVLLLEDDLLGWGSIVTAVADRLSDDVDLVSVARTAGEWRPGRVRAALQPAVRRLLRVVSGHDLADPTSPLKAARRAAFPGEHLERWRDLLDEGLLVGSRQVAEVFPASIVWDGRPSRHRGREVAVQALRLASRLVRHALSGAAPSRAP